MTKDVDVQAQAISNGLQALSDLLQEPIAREALDLEKNAETAKRYDTLRRLRRSLTQYLERDGDLFYVSLLGHFSAGKSSTINCILDLWNTPHERKTKLGPTDKAITLITSSSNSSFLLGVINEGTVTIRYEGVEHPLLEGVVIADTPGSGDPQQLAEIAREFLPICDVILFVFAASNTLDQTDMPILEELQKRLAFIPIVFVVTRANEFSVNRAIPIADNNINQTKRNEFFEDVLLRINELLKPAKFTENDFILIDNLDRYNISALIELIKSKCDRVNPQSRITMHAHKIRYYLSFAKELRTFFAAFLDGKLIELNKIVESAQSNIQTYNETVSISNNYLAKDWVDRLSSIRSTREAALRRLSVLPQLPSGVSGFEPVAQKRAEIRVALSAGALDAARSIEASAKREILSRVRNFFRGMDKRSSRINLDDLAADRFRIAIPSTTFDGLSGSFAMTAVAVSWSSLRETEASALRKAIEDLKKQANEMEQLVQLRTPLNECDKEVAAAQGSLSNDLNLFFRNVELYREGVFSRSTKASISTLGIGEQMDALELEFTPSEKATFVDETTRQLFPDASENSAKALTRLTELDKKLRLLVEKLGFVRLAPPDPNLQKLLPSVEAEKGQLVTIVEMDFQKELHRLTSQLELALAGEFIEARSACQSAISEAKRKRIYRYICFIVGAGLLGVVGWQAYLHLTEEAPHSWFWAIVLHVLADLIGSLVGYLFAKFSDGFPKAVSRIREDHEILARKKMDEILSDELRKYESSNLSELNPIEKIGGLYNRALLIDPDGWNERAAQQLEDLRPLYSEFMTMYGEYTEAIEDLVNTVSAYFSDATKNLAHLNDAAVRIKEKAIEPSFALLAKARASLGDVRTRLQAIEFS